MKRTARRIVVLGSTNTDMVIAGAAALLMQLETPVETVAWAPRAGCARRR